MVLSHFLEFFITRKYFILSYKSAGLLTVNQFKKPTGALPIRRALQSRPQGSGTHHQLHRGTLPQRPQQKAGQQLQGELFTIVE